MSTHKPGDYIKILTFPGRKFLVTSNYHGGPLVECREVMPNGDLANGYSPFEGNTAAFETEGKST